MRISGTGRQPMRRRLSTAAALFTVASIALVGCSSASEGGGDGATAAEGEVQLVEGVRSLSNSYHANWVAGGELFGESIGEKVTVLSDEADSQRQLSQIRALAGSGQVYALNVDPNTSADTEAIVRAVTDAGGYVVTHWNKPDDLNPWDIGDHWVAHISFDGRSSGEEVSNLLFDEMGGEGGIIAIQGILDNTSAQQRYEGLTNALADAPGIELLDSQTANWSRTEALTVTQTLLAKHGDAIQGIWAANDEMALGALEALRAAGLEGTIPIIGFDAVPQALDEIQSGTSGFIASVSSDAFWQGGAGLSLAYQAATGQIDVSELSNDERAFYGTQIVVTAENVGDFLETPSLDALQTDFDDPFARSQGAIN
ncbi:MAG: transporter substrate-binding protein [Microbacteriaceae bacterium]|jgi:ribose transport system substrate-binding protein|nr:transporter substrate-binding protein [Microbacteriaceae bacterium]